MGKLNPRGRKTVRIEAVAELEIGCAIEVLARRLAGVPWDADAGVPAGYKADAIRRLIVEGASTIPGLADEANAQADKIRHETHED